MKHRRAAKVDANQPAIVAALRSIPGVTVSTGKDDILVGYNGKTYWYEIKASETAEIKESQKRLLREWKGHYKVVWSIVQILEDIKCDT